MNKTIKMRMLSILLCFVMLFSLMSTVAIAYYEEPTAEGNAALETTVFDYTQPVGATMQRLTGNCVTENGNLGDDLLFVIKSGERYYAMKDVAASEEEYDAIPAVDVTAWVNADGSLTVPADTLGVAFWRYEQRPEYEYAMFINGRQDYLAYTYDYESTDGDDNYYNDAERNYWGKFEICTFEDGGYIQSDPYYWSENGTSGTLKFNGSWSYKISSYNYLYLKYNVIVDLRSDENGGQEFYFRYLGTDVEYVGDEVEGYIYYADCRHQFTVRHGEYDAPTCMLKGCQEYWYCEGCNKYFKDEAMTQLWGESMPIIPATGHDWDNGTCANCNRPVPVYSKVTNQADFNALADDTMFILVSEYGGKYYAPDLGDLSLYLMDSDGDGYRDIHDIDENGNDIPDYLEFDDGGEAGVYDYLEWDMDGDGDVDEDDHREFSEMICDQYLTDRLYKSKGIDAIEVTMNSNGTFSHEAVKATAEFEMVDLYLKEEIDDMINFVKESEDWWTDDMRYTYECIKQFAIPNMFLTAPSMAPVERQYQQRIAEVGDTYSWGVLFYNNASDYQVYNYETASIEQAKLNDVCTQDSVVVFDTFDYMWYDATWNRQLGQLRLRDYNGTISFVTGEDYMLEGSEWIYDEITESGYYETHDTQAAVYLYASQQSTHTCEFKNWKANEDGRTHTGTCTCGETKTEDHRWDNDACAVCGAVGIHDADALCEFLESSEGNHAVLFQDVHMDNENMVIARGNSLDLNGHAITANTMVILDGDRILDSSETQSGSLNVPKGSLYIFGENTDCIPVWDEANSCYILATASYQQMLNEKEDASLEYTFIPNFDSKTIDLLKNGGGDNGVSIKVQMTWNNGASRQIYTFSEEMVEQVYSSFRDGVADKVFLLTITGAEGIDDMQISAVVESSAGGKLASKP